MKTTSFKEAKSSRKSMAELRSSTGLYSRMRRFAREDDGNLTVMGVFMFVGIVAMCGVGVDLMLNEKERTRLQNTLDRAVLAAADLDQKGNATSVVESYFDAAGLPHTLADVTVDQGLNYKTVSASASSAVDPLFIDVLGVDSMTAPAAGAAEERVGKVEISLVVDISGSMRRSAADGGTRLDALKEASDDFLEIVLDPANGGMTTVSVVPYNHTVNLGQTFASYMKLDNNHNYSNCVRFSDSSFGSLSISPTTTLDRLSHFDIFNYNWSTSPIGDTVCPTDDYAEIKVHSNNVSELSTHIHSLNADGNTAIDLGMKWGVGLLDDAMAPAISNMIGAGDVPAMAANRPADYDDPETLKIVVLMTDGENTSQWDLFSNFQKRNSWTKT